MLRLIATEWLPTKLKPKPGLLPTLLSVTRELSTIILFSHLLLISISKPKLPSNSNLLFLAKLLLLLGHLQSLEANYFVNIIIEFVVTAVHSESTVLQFLQVSTSFEESQYQSSNFSTNLVLFIMFVPDLHFQYLVFLKVVISYELGLLKQLFALALNLNHPF